MRDLTRIVHIIGAINNGGAERFVVDLCNELAKNTAYRVDLISICKNDNTSSIIQEISPSVHYVCFDKKSGFSPLAFSKLTYWLMQNKPHIVHTHLNAFEYVYAYLLFSKGCSFYHTLHSMAQYECPKFFAVKKFRSFFYSRNKVKPITISDNGRETYRRYYKLTNDTIIANGRPEMHLSSKVSGLQKKYKSNPNNFLLLHIGRISEEKNQRLLISAVKKFNQTQHHKCRLLMIGWGEETLRAELTQLGKDDSKIEFLGLKKNIADYLRIADLFCLSSNCEGMPLVIIEAFSMGCIPLSTPVGGVPQMISHGETGFLTKDLSLEAYYSALEQALFSRNRIQIGNACKKEFKARYHIEIATVGYLKAYALSLDQGAAMQSL